MLREAMDVSEQQGRDAAARDLEGEAHAGADEHRDRRGGRRLCAARWRARNWIDFDDLRRPRVARAVGRSGACARSYREQFRFISVDEFQDIDEQQYRLIAQLAPPGANLCVIGDPDQAIYGFRGADASCFARFRREYAPQEVRAHAQLPLQRHDRGGVGADARRARADGSDRARDARAHHDPRGADRAQPKPSSWCRPSKG